MIALYELATQYRADAAKLSDLDLDPITLADTLQSLGGELEVKAQAVAAVVRNIEATAHAIKDHIARQRERMTAMEHRAESLRDYLAVHLTACGIERIEGPGMCISWRKSSAVVIDEPGLIPSSYMRQPEPPPPEPDKRRIKEVLDAGQAVPGAHIEHRRNLAIR